MEESFYIKYSKVHQTFLNRKLLTIEKLLNDLLMAEECIGFQFWLSDEIADLSKRHETEWKNYQKQIAHELYNRNLHYLYSTLELAYAGLCDPAYNIIRTVHESVLKMYYLALYPEEVENVLDDMEPGKPSKYNHNFLNQRLYTETMQESMRKQFAELSAKSHSNYSGIGTTLIYSIEQIKDCLWFIRLLSFYNIITEIENQSTDPSILEKYQTDKVNNYLEKMRKTLVDEKGTMGSYFPDKPDLRQKLHIKPGQLTNS